MAGQLAVGLLVTGVTVAVLTRPWCGSGAPGPRHVVLGLRPSAYGSRASSWVHEFNFPLDVSHVSGAVNQKLRMLGSRGGRPVRLGVCNCVVRSLGLCRDAGLDLRSSDLADLH